MLCVNHIIHLYKKILINFIIKTFLINYNYYYYVSIEIKQ